MKTFFIALVLLASNFASASIFSDRQSAAIENARQSRAESETNRFLRGNAQYRNFLKKFAANYGGLRSDSTCRVGTNYSFGDGPSTPYGSMNISVNELPNHAGATFECDLNLGNGLACRVDTSTTMGQVYNYPAHCRESRHYLWAHCIDGNGKARYICYK